MKRVSVCPHCGAPMYRDVCEYCQMPAVSPTAPVKKQNYVWLWGVLVAVVLVICVLSAAVLCYYIKGNAYRRTWMVRSTASGTSENDAAVLEKMQENGVFSSGTYLVGEEIPAGEYAVISESGEADHLFYAGVYADQEKEQEISGEWHEYSAIVQLEEGTYFSFSWANCYDMTKNTIPNDPTKHPGMFCVGRDIEPGTYTICPYEKENHDLYPTYAVYTSLGSVAPVIAESGSLYDPSDSTLLDAVTLTLEEGQYLKLSQCIVAE